MMQLRIHKKHSKQMFQSGLTLIETLVLIVIGAVLVGMLLPARFSRKRPAYKTACINNLKQVSIGFRLFANDNDNRFPTQISTNNGGSMEWTNITGEAWRHFWAAGDELSNPRILVCPSDNTPDRGYPVDFLSSGDDMYLSYFIGLAAQPGTTNQILLGDADIHFNGRLMPKATSLPLSTNYSWGKRHKGGTGNIGFTDGSVSSTTDRKLIEAVKQQYETIQSD